jgi:hypothetical protein
MSKTRSQIEIDIRALGYTVESGTARPTAKDVEIIGKMGTVSWDIPARAIGFADQEKLDQTQLGYIILGIPVTANGYKDVPRFIRCRVRDYVDQDHQGTWEFDGTPRDYTDIPLSELIDKVLTVGDIKELTGIIDSHLNPDPVNGFRYDPTQQTSNEVKMPWEVAPGVVFTLKKADIRCKKIPNDTSKPVTEVTLFVQSINGTETAFREMA